MPSQVVIMTAAIIINPTPKNVSLYFPTESMVRGAGRGVGITIIDFPFGKITVAVFIL
jgi:hypothetical protein